MSDTVTELESRVDELRASVDELLDELVDTKERVNQLESRADSQNARTHTEQEIGTKAQSEGESDLDDGDDSGTDIIVA